MKSFTVLILSLFLSGFLYGQLHNPGTNNYASEIIEYSGNIFYLVGTTHDAFGKKGDDIIISKINLSTQKVESKVFGSEYTDRGYGIEKLKNGNMLITGESWKTFNKWGRENPFLMEIDTNLNKVWAKAYYLSNRDGGLSCKELNDGNLILAGYSRSVNTGAHSIGDVLVIKTTPEGDTLYQKAIYSAGNDYGFDIMELPSGNTMILAEASGFFNSNQADYRFAHDADLMFVELDQNGNEIKRKLWGGEGHELTRKIIKSPGDDGYLIAGSTQSYGSGNFDILLLKIDNDYNEVWHKTFGDKNIDYGNSMAISPSGDSLYIACTTTGEQSNPQSTVICTDLDGNMLWKKNYYLDDMTFSADIVAKKSGGCVLLGYSGEQTDEYKIFVLNLNGKGEEINAILSAYEVLPYPNPVKWGENIHFKIIPPRHTGIDNYALSIKNVLGQQIDRIEGSGRIISYPTDKLRRGIYLYKFISGEVKISGKFIIH